MPPKTLKAYKTLNGLAWRAMGDHKLRGFTLMREDTTTGWLAFATSAARFDGEHKKFVGRGQTPQEAAIAMIAEAEKVPLRKARFM